MARWILFLLLILFFGNVTNFVQVAAEDEGGSWSQSYEELRKLIKPLTPRAKASCEMLLKEILTDLDTKNNCSTDSHCRLIDQDPFGATIPILTEEAKKLETKTKKFREACDDGTLRSVRHNEIENIPVCWKNKCMVKSRLKKR